MRNLCGGKRLPATLSAIIMCCCWLNAPASGQHARAEAGGLTLKDFKTPIPDLALVNQEGKEVRLYSDLIKGKLVVLGFFYTRCEYMCSLQGQTFSRLQEQLGARLNEDVFLVAISRDPQADTPLRLKTWAKKFGARPGWSLLTGRADDLGDFVRRFTGDGLGPVELHSTLVYVIDGDSGRWFAASGVAETEHLMGLIDKLAALRQPAARL